MEAVSYQLNLLPEVMALCRLAPGMPIPEWTASASLLNITRTAEELSILCDSHLVPSNVKVEGGWRVFKMIGPLEFTMVGVLASVLNPLAEAGITILAVSTYDTDYILVTEPDLKAAKAALHAAGHLITA